MENTVAEINFTHSHNQVEEAATLLASHSENTVESSPAVLNDCPIAVWLQRNAHHWLLESIQQLPLVEVDQTDHHLKELDEKSLAVIKRRVKTELKDYNFKFREHFGRLPQRHEKFPIRRLYVYYHHIKKTIHQRQSMQG
mmetsp:Transcript_23160/g.26233  ORF Transcript_23160/g.26233 Transcript_23160/m.26233 type:complete len:140 (-) Transcript_23160:1247-1666(-)